MKNGFSLIEMLVAISIFTFVALLTVGSLLILTAAEKRISGIQSAQDNLRFAMEAITREARIGIDHTGSDSSGGPCVGNPSCLSFENVAGENVVYQLLGGAIKKQVDGGVYNALTSPEITIEKLTFNLKGEEGIPDFHQPRVTIIVDAIAHKGTKNETKMNIQTTVSRRTLQIL